MPLELEVMGAQTAEKAFPTLSRTRQKFWIYVIICFLTFMTSLLFCMYLLFFKYFRHMQVLNDPVVQLKIS